MAGPATEEGSLEMVALRLFHFICAAEKRSFEAKAGYEIPDRGWILHTYGECLATVKGQR